MTVKNKIKSLIAKIKSYSKPDPNGPKLTNRQLAEKFKAENEAERKTIKALHGKAKLKAWLKWFFLFPLKWCWVNFRDWRIVVIFLVWCAILSSEVWGCYLASVIMIGNPTTITITLPVAIGPFKSITGTISQCLVWLGDVLWAWWWIPDPLSNFMLYVIALTIGTKAVMDKIKSKGKK